MTNKPLVLVTGASGYIAMHCIIQLLKQGYPVRGTLRSLNREARLRSIFKDYVSAATLEFVVADLTSDDGWDAAMQGCTYVLHVASPVPASDANTFDDFLRPAQEGTRRVLTAAAKAGVKRLVQTSSVAAVNGDIPDAMESVSTEEDWTDLDRARDYYVISKTMAERAMWEFAEEHPELELAAVNPVFVIGPVFDERFSSSITIIANLLKREYPALPKMGFSLVDVRDVAAAHLLAMTSQDANGKRFICSTEFLWYREIAQILNRHFADKGYKSPTMTLPSFLARILARFDRALAFIVPSLGKKLGYSNKQLKTVLNWKPRPMEQSIIDTAQSLIDKGAV